MTAKETKLEIIKAGHKAIAQLIKVAKEDILNGDEDDISPEKLKNAAACKKLAIFDSFEILSRIELEKQAIEIEEKGAGRTDTKNGFAERNSK